MERNDDIIEIEEFHEEMNKVDIETEIEKRFNQLQQAVDNYQFELLKKALYILKVTMKYTLKYFDEHDNRELVNEILGDIMCLFENTNDRQIPDFDLKIF